MSIETSFLNIERITINPVQTSPYLGSRYGQFSTQRGGIQCKDGGEHALTLFLPAGQSALALGDLVTHEQGLA